MLMTHGPKSMFVWTTTRAFVCGILLAATLPGVAQEAPRESSMASRMLLELQQMREEVRELRGLVEAQSQEIENLKRRQRDQYLDLDRRLGELSSGSGQTSRVQPSAAGNGNTRRATETMTLDEERAASSADDSNDDSNGDLNDDSGTAARDSGDERSQVGQIAPPEVRDALDEQPEVTTLADSGDGAARALREPTEAERQAYDQAFRALRETRYADAAEGFDAFLREHTDSAYAPNALYWLGEVYYVTRDFETALTQFERLQDTYPDSSKQPDALLKIGFSHYELANWDRARAALEQVVADYPGTNYSRLAENRLRTMRLEGNL